MQQTHFNYNQITQLFKESHFIPFSAWAISPSTILHVLNDIVINKRKGILEFGAGASTFYIAKCIKTLKLDTKFYSIESDKVWAEELNRQLAILDIDDFVKIIYAPIVEVPQQLGFRDQRTWYDIDIIESKIKDEKFDVILVDGPVGAGTPYARYTAIPFLQEKLMPQYSIFLDDVNRHHEQEIVLEWKKMIKCSVTYRERYAVLSNSSNFEVHPFQLG